MTTLFDDVSSVDELRVKFESKVHDDKAKILS